MDDSPIKRRKVRVVSPVKLSPGGAVDEAPSSDEEHSSYAGSQRDDSEISDLDDDGGNDEG